MNFPRKVLPLAVMVVALAGLITAELQDDPVSRTDGGEGLEKPAGGATPATPIVAGRKDAVYVATILNRPLFSPSRRPDAATATTTSGGPGRLAGIIVSPSGKAAIFSGTSGGKPLVVEEGGSLGNYMVDSIEIGEVSIIGPSGRQTLRPAFDPSPPPTPGKPPVPSAPRSAQPK